MVMHRNIYIYIYTGHALVVLSLALIRISFIRCNLKQTNKKEQKTLKSRLFLTLFRIVYVFCIKNIGMYISVHKK